MMTPGFGIAELLVIFIVVALWLAVPVGILYVLYIIYRKLASIEDLLKKNNKQ